jgi:hypothetical protein
MSALYAALAFLSLGMTPAAPLAARGLTPSLAVGRLPLLRTEPARPPRVAPCQMYENDFRPDPAWQRDSILLLCYCGIEDLFRAAATGVKAKIGFDFVQLNVELSSALLVAVCWLLAAQVTGVTGAEFRYDKTRVLATWVMAAIPPLIVRPLLFGGFLVGDPAAAVTDAVATLGLMLGLRLAEQQGYV